MNEPQRSAVGLPDQQGSDRVVMVVEDEVLIRIMAVDIFQTAGFRVVEASSADEAMNLLAAGLACDLVFSDVNMPGSMDGMGLVAYAERHFPDVPVVLTSGGVSVPQLTEVRPAAIISKPYSEADLARVIQLLLGPQ